MSKHPNRLAGERYQTMSSVPFVLVHLVALGAFVGGFSRADLVFVAVTFWVRMFFITGGYHRYFSHRAYRTSRAFQFVLALGGLTAVQKGPLWWAGHHRLHHRYTDTVNDVHSPIKGRWFSHVGWILTPQSSPTPTDAIGDFAKFPELRFLNRFDVIGPLVFIGVCVAWGGVDGVLLGALSTVLLWHATFLVNSASHLWGSRRYATDDTSRNNWWVALLTMGEGWHNNHHHIQSSARQGFRWYEIDVTYYILRVLAALRIVHGLRPPNPKMLRSKLISEGAIDLSEPLDTTPDPDPEPRSLHAPSR